MFIIVIIVIIVIIIIITFCCSYYMVWLYFCLKKQNSFTNEYKKMHVFS